MFDAPIPTYLSITLDEFRYMNGTFASPAKAFASSVLPVPGEPVSSNPFGCLM